jgi:hypothetical protein
MNQTKYLWIGVVVAIVIAIISLFHEVSAPSAGGITTGTGFTHGISVGNPTTLGVVPTNFKKILAGTCNLSQSVAGSHAATTTKEYFCAVPGVSANDLVLVDLPAGAGLNPNGASSLAGGFVAIAAYATTSNVIAVQLDNFTGVATSSFPQATTSVEYYVFGTQ